MTKSTFIFTIVALLFSFACSNKQLYTNDEPAYSIGYDEEVYDAYDTAYYEDDTQKTTIAYEDYKASRTVYTNLINTKLEIKPDWKTSYLHGKATITAKPHFYPSDSLILDAKGMTINSVSLHGKPLHYTYENEVLKITLDKIYTREESYTVVIDYIAKPNERKTSSGQAVTSDKGLYFINPTNEEGGFMPQIWTQGEPESSSVWFPTIDSPNFKSAQEIYVTVEDKYKTLSNGKLISSVKNADGTRTDYWKQEQKHSVYLFMLAVGEFAVVEDVYTKKDGTKMPVHYYVEPEWKEQAQVIFGKTPKMISFFSELLGIEYPWDKYHQIIVREYVSGAMENTGAVIFGDFCYKTDRELLDDNDESIIAHELFHHWFGNLVTAESWSNLPLNESFANYSQYLWDEYEYGIDLAQYNKEKVIRAYLEGFEQHKLIRFDYENPDDMFDVHSYNKGGSILHQLRGYLGDEAFFAGLNLYLTKNAYKAAEYNDLRLAFEEISGEDLNWYFNNWFLGEGYPSLKATHSFNYEKTRFNLNFKQGFIYQDFVVPMEIMYVDDAGKHLEKIKITKEEQQFSFPIKGELQTIILDPNKSLLVSPYFTSTPEFWEKQLGYATNYLTKKEAFDNYIYQQKDKDKIKAFAMKTLQDTFFGIQKTVLEELYHKLGTVAIDIDALIDISVVKELARNGSHHEVRSAAIQLFMEFPVSEAEKVAFLDELSANEQSYKVLATILEFYIQIDPDNSGVKIDEFSLKHASSDINFQIALYYIQNRVGGKIDFFKTMYEQASLRDKWVALIYYGYYSFSNSLEDMKNFVPIVDAVYQNTGRYKTQITSIMVDVTQELMEQEAFIEAQIEKENSAADKQFFLEQIKDLRLTYQNFLEKHGIAIE